MPSDRPRRQVDAEASLPVRSEPKTAAAARPGAQAADACRNPNGIQGCQNRRWQRIARPPVLLMILLACWRWLMSTARGFGPSRHGARAPQDAVLPADLRPGPRLALVHAPPIRLLT